MHRAMMMTDSPIAVMRGRREWMCGRDENAVSDTNGELRERENVMEECETRDGYMRYKTVCVSLSVCALEAS